MQSIARHGEPARRFVGGDRLGNNWLKVETANSMESRPNEDNCSSINDRCCHLWSSPDQQLSRVILWSNERRRVSSRESGGPASRPSENVIRIITCVTSLKKKKNAVFTFVLEHGGFVWRFWKLSSTDVREGELYTVNATVRSIPAKPTKCIVNRSFVSPFLSQAPRPLYGFERKDNARHLALLVSSDFKTLSMSCLSYTHCLKIESQHKTCKSICTNMFMKKQKESLVIHFVDLLAVMPFLTACVSYTVSVENDYTHRLCVTVVKLN